MEQITSLMIAALCGAFAVGILLIVTNRQNNN